MPGTKDGGKTASETIKLRYGKDFYARIGQLGGKLGRTGGFGSPNVGDDGLTGKQRAAVAGKIGGKLSKRGSKAKGELNDS